MRDIEYLARPAVMPRLIVYRFANRPLKASFLAHIREAARELKRGVSYFDPEGFALEMDGGGLFGSRDAVAILDWEVSQPTRLQGNEEPTDYDDKNFLSAAYYIRCAELRPADAITAVILVPAKEKALSWWSPAAEDLLVNGADFAHRPDIHELVRVLAPKRLTGNQLDELTEEALQLFRLKLPFDQLCEEIDTRATLKGTPFEEPASKETRVSKQRVARRAGHLLYSFVIGKGGSRLDLISHLHRPYREPAQLLEEVLRLTAQLFERLNLNRQAVDEEDLLDLSHALMWLAMVLAYWPLILAAGPGRGQMWPRPDISVFVIFGLLDDFLQLRARGAVMVDESVLRLACTYAGEMHTTLPRATERLKSALKGTIEMSQDTALLDGQRISMAAADLLASFDPTVTEQEKFNSRATRYSSLNDLIGREALKSSFLQHFDDRNENIWAFGKPLLLIGPDDTGKRLAADLLARLFVCEAASSDSPVECGKCPSCETADFRILQADIEKFDGIDDGEEIFLQELTSRGTFAGTPVRVIFSIDKARPSTIDRLLKSIEKVRSGLFIFTTRDKRAVPDTLRSRCAPIHLWPLKQKQAIQVVEQYASELGVDLDPHTIIDLARRSNGLAGRIVRDLDALHRSGASQKSRGAKELPSLDI